MDRRKASYYLLGFWERHVLFKRCHHLLICSLITTDVLHLELALTGTGYYRHGRVTLFDEVM